MPPFTLKIVEPLRKTIWGQICLGRLGEELIVVKLSNVKNDEPRLTCEDSVQESKILRTIPPHPNIVEYIFDFKVMGRTLSWNDPAEVQVLLLENLPGGDLFDHLDRRGRLTEAEARRFFIQIFAGLKHIHEHGFCHMDLSLENILLSEDRKVIKICDFGQAQRIDTLEKEKHQTRRRGKKMYMAPEIANLEESICGISCDLYSLGIVLFCMLTGVQPYMEPNYTDLGFSLIINGELETLFVHLEIPFCSCICNDELQCLHNVCPNPAQHVISPLALDFLAGLICHRENRFTVQQIEQHPWLAEEELMLK
jgi:serine/threonine protein kinase